MLLYLTNSRYDVVFGFLAYSTHKYVIVYHDLQFVLMLMVYQKICVLVFVVDGILKSGIPKISMT
jgi:hypothetical protein